MIKTFDNESHHPFSVTLGRFRKQHIAGEYQEMRSQGAAAQWDPYGRLALAILAQAWTDAIHKPWPSQPRKTGPVELRRRKEDAILFLRSMDGAHYEDRLFWLEVAYPQSNPRNMDRILQLRMDARGMPKV